MHKKTILHICTYSYFTPGLSYQENNLSEFNSRDGHEVVILTDTECYEYGEITEVPVSDSVINNGVRLIRLGRIRSRCNILDLILKKVKYFQGFESLIVDINPDVVLYHGIVGLNLYQLKGLQKKIGFDLYLDTHADFNNSGKNRIGYYFLYVLLYRNLYRYIRNSVKRVFYISRDTLYFAKKVYGINNTDLEFLPLGGKLVSESRKEHQRSQFRSQHNIGGDVTVFLHTGKLTSDKRTDWILDFVEDMEEHESIDDFLVIIAGAIPSEQSEIESRILESKSVLYLGWLNELELETVLCASDVYIQPGSQSATMQKAICTGLPVVLWDHDSHRDYVLGNGYLVDSKSAFNSALIEILTNKDAIKPMSDCSTEIAKKMLDYECLSRKYL